MEAIIGINRLDERVERMDKRKNGFTLIEMLVAMLIAFVILGGIYVVYTSQQRSYKTTEDVTSLQQNIRSAMFFIEKDIRMAGYDPRLSGNFTAIDVQANSITLTMDDNLNGISELTDANGNLDAGETFTYALNGTRITRDDHTGPPQPQVLAENVSRLVFQYFDRDGQVIAPASGVTTVNVVNVVLSGMINGHPRLLQTRIWIRNHY
jgi:prepilin-type N-terminal cleavage/methylation domain-containing protein